jgi:peptide-methionine (S)-S-oxide reductase
VSKREPIPLPEAGQALPGRNETMAGIGNHLVSGRSLKPPFPQGFSWLLLGMGCFWGAERLFWQRPGVYVTAVGYAGGQTPNPTYEEVCSGMTGHAEVVLVVYETQAVSMETLLRLFWEGHYPTQGMRQGNDIGTQYRSALFCPDQVARDAILASKEAYQQALNDAGRGEITTSITIAPPFYYAEPYHQQYLARNPDGYCGLGGTGVAFP